MPEKFRNGLDKKPIIALLAGSRKQEIKDNLLTIQYLGNGKALAYARNDAAGTAIDSYSHYYSIIDLATGERTRLSYEGKELAYSGGRFSQRSVVFNEKAYFGVNTEADTNAIIYIYDTKTGVVEKGAEVAGEFYFDMIRVIEND